MTQPIQEPNTQRSLSQGKWGENQLFRRPAPSSFETAAAYFDRLDFNGTGQDIANNTWVNVVTGDGSGANDRYFCEFFEYGDSLGRTFSTGAITSSESALFSVWGYVEFEGGSVAVGTTIGVGLEFVGQEFQVNTGIRTINRAGLMVSAERAPLPAGGVKLQAYQLSGGTAQIQSARLHVRRFELLDGGTFEDNPNC